MLLSAGHDQVSGGAGRDTVAWTPTYDTAYDLTYSYYHDYRTGIYESYSGDTAADVTIDLAAGRASGSGFDTDLAGVENVTTGVGNDHVTGDALANRISVGHGANVVFGGGGADTISGSGVENTVFPWEHSSTDFRDAAEVLHGGSGNDRIVGGTTVFGDTGNDTLVAGWNRNVMTGGSGADHFVFSDADETPDGPEVRSQSGSILDFDASAGDRLIIDRVHNSNPAYEFVGYAASDEDVPVGYWGSSTAASSCAPGDLPTNTPPTGPTAFTSPSPAPSPRATSSSSEPPSAPERAAGNEDASGSDGHAVGQGDRFPLAPRER